MIGAASSALPVLAVGGRVSCLGSGRSSRGATAAGMGHLVCMDDNPAELALSAYSLRLWREVTGGCRKRVPGAAATLWLADKRMKWALPNKSGRGWRSRVNCGTVDGGAKRIAAVEPMLRHGLAGGLRGAGR